MDVGGDSEFGPVIFVATGITAIAVLAVSATITLVPFVAWAVLVLATELEIADAFVPPTIFVRSTALVRSPVFVGPTVSMSSTTCVRSPVAVTSTAVSTVLVFSMTPVRSLAVVLWTGSWVSVLFMGSTVFTLSAVVIPTREVMLSTVRVLSVVASDPLNIRPVGIAVASVRVVAVTIAVAFALSAVASNPKGAETVGIDAASGRLRFATTVPDGRVLVKAVVLWAPGATT